MTMFPAADHDHPQNLRKKKKKKKKNSTSSLLQGGSIYGTDRDPTNFDYNNYNYDCFISLGRRQGREGSDLIMADKDASKMSENISIGKNEEETTGSSSKDYTDNNQEAEMNMIREDDGGWLQLSLGSSCPDQISLANPPPRRRLVELDLLSPPPPTAASSSSSSGGGETWSLTLTHPQQQQRLSFQIPEYQAPAAFFVQPHDQERATAAPIDLMPGAMTFTHHHHQQQQQQYDNNYMPFRRPYPRLSMDITDSSPSLDQRPPPSDGSSSRGSFHFIEPSGHRMDFRMVDPPRRPHSGVWFTLQASQNQRKQPHLPQIPKSYLRIKDGKTTVRLLIKYLVNKLKLNSEFEIEITCKGQQLLPFLTIQHVRDNIWNSPRRNNIVFPHYSATIDHLMVLNYGRINA